MELKNDIVFFDLETTGVFFSKDRIVQIGIIKIFADKTKPIYKNLRLINPTIPIPEEATAVHKITDDMVKDAPTFKQISKKLFELIGDSDLGGYNLINFDIPLLIEEFNRVGIEFSVGSRKIVDVFKIKQKMEPNTLEANYKYYCGKEMEGAHDALVDIQATVDIFKEQVKKYKGIDFKNQDGEIIKDPINNIDSIHELLSIKNAIDLMGKIVYNKEGVPVFNFGKYINLPVKETLEKDSWYYNNYILDKNKSGFTSETIDKFILIMEGKMGKK
jgi:DNA polymerase-3 subunit epsilon